MESTMKLQGPYKYEISVQGQDGYSVVGPNNVTNFVAPVTKRGPKLYVFSDAGNLIYIGQTVQGMSARMRLGFKATLCSASSVPSSPQTGRGRISF